MTRLEALTLVAFGLVAGLGELLARYGKTKNVFWRCQLFWLYLAINSVIGLFVLVVLRALGLELDAHGNLVDAQRVGQVAAAGVSGLALLRTATYARRFAPGGDPGAVTGGLAEGGRAIIGYLVTQLDGQVNNRLNNLLTKQAESLSLNWSFADKSKQVLETCAKLAGLSREQTKALADEATTIAEMDLPDPARNLLLARLCILWTSREVVDKALNQLGLHTPAPVA